MIVTRKLPLTRTPGAIVPISAATSVSPEVLPLVIVPWSSCSVPTTNVVLGSGVSTVLMASRGVLPVFVKSNAYRSVSPALGMPL